MPRFGTLVLMGSLAGLFVPLGAPLVVQRVTGTVEGVVRTGGATPVQGARVLVDGTGLAATSGTDGRYRIAGVPAGQVTLTARALGHATARKTVEVASGAVTRVDFELRAESLRLEEMVVSGGVTSPAGSGLRASRPATRALGVRSGGRFNTEEYKRIEDNAWFAPATRPLSTFSVDVDAASYSNVRRFITEGRLPPADAVRIEEMVNYFRYGYPEPSGPHPFTVTTELAAAPWHATHQLVLVGLQTARVPVEDLPPANLVFLVDVSGSMSSPDKLPLVKSAFRLLVHQLRPQDHVAIVVYAGAAGLVLPPTSGSDKETILAALNRLEAGGSTAGSAGIQLAYETARRHYRADGNNRVILATDGDFNVGPSSEGELLRLIEARRDAGVFLTVLGFGTGNLKDARMEQLADKGNGHFAYVDNLLEARKVFVQELGATLLTVAKDVKLQVEFNPARVAAYRLVGYENRVMADEDFTDDRKDAGDMGAGHSVTALYEIVPVGAPLDVPVGTVEPLRYQGTREGRVEGRGDWLTVKIRYKRPSHRQSRALEAVVRSVTDRPSETFRFAASVAGVGMLLRDSEHKGTATWPSMLALARGARGDDREGYRSEFLRLVESMAQLAGQAGDGSGR